MLPPEPVTVPLVSCITPNVGVAVPRLSVAPFCTLTKAPGPPRPLLLPTSSTPAEIVVVPVKVFAPANSTVPAASPPLVPTSTL